ILTPKAFSRRNAMLPDRPALPFSKLERAGRETRSAAAAAVTERPAGSMISVRMKSPGWGGFFKGMVAYSACPVKSLVIVFQIHVADFALRSVDAECQTPVAGNTQAPCTLPIARQGVNFPGRKHSQFLRFCHVVKKGEHLTQLVDSAGRYAFRAVFRIEPLEALVGEVSYSHRTSCYL